MDIVIRSQVGSTVSCWYRKDQCRQETQLRMVISNDADIRILLYAHDLAEAGRIALDLVTGDDNDIGNNANAIMGKLTIRSIMPLSNFSSAALP